MDQTQQQQQQAQQPSQQQNPQPQQQVSAATNTTSAATATTTDATMQQQQQQQEPRLQQQQKFVPTDSSSDSDRAAKKSAQLGQWRTPPQPFFPSNPSATSATAVAPTSAASAVIQSSAPGVPGGPQPMSTIPTSSASTTSGGSAAGQAGPGGVAPAAVGGGAATAAVAAATAGTSSSTSGDAAATAGGGSGGGSDLGDFDLASLQEAYRRGMEAARALSQHQLATGQNVFVEPMGTATTAPTMTSGATAPTAGAPPAPAPAAVIVGSSASCPNLQELNAAQRQQQQQAAAYKPSGVMEEPDPQQQPHPHHQAQAQQQQFGSGYQPHAHPGAAFVSQPAPSAPATAAVQQQQPYAPTGTPATASPHPPTPANTPMVSVQHPADGGMGIPQQPQQHHHPQIPPMQQHHHPQQPMNVAARSVSLPDMQSYAVKASQEEDKRRKRLARNRASARLRRLRKKNLVESYEGEVGVLESSLSKLRAHSWGTSDDHEALLEALSMERGQQNLSPEARRDLIRDILAQQREQVSNLMDAQLESMTLGWLVRRSHQSPPAAGGVVGDQKVSGEGPDKMKEDGDAVGGTKPTDAEDEERRKKEEDDLAKELEDVLQLTPQQAMQLQKATEGAEEERKAIRTVDMCLEAMMNNSWLLNQGVEECVEQFASILNPGQMSKFLLWTDHNSEAIDQLDYVNAPPASSPPSQTPSFVFGTDDCSHHDDADDGKGQTQHQQHHMQISSPQ